MTFGSVSDAKPRFNTAVIAFLTLDVAFCMGILGVTPVDRIRILMIEIWRCCDLQAKVCGEL
jgi:hypothetical protein